MNIILLIMRATAKKADHNFKSTQKSTKFVDARGQQDRHHVALVHDEGDKITVCEHARDYRFVLSVYFSCRCHLSARYRDKVLGSRWKLFHTVTNDERDWIEHIRMSIDLVRRLNSNVIQMYR